MDVPQTTLRNIRAVVDASASGANTRDAIKSKARISARHVSYAVSAARTLGLVEVNRKTVTATPTGVALAQSPKGSEEAAAIMVESIDGSRAMRLLAPGLLSQTAPSKEVVSANIVSHGKLGSGTANHRAAMILKWRDDLVNRKIDFSARRKTQNPKESMGILEVRNFAQIRHARIAFGDLTVLVGPQATGKSLLLQWFKAAFDMGEIVAALEEAGHDVKTAKNLIDLTFGEGMSAAWNENTSITYDTKSVSPKSWTRGLRRQEHGRVFFIPAHRALLLAEGWPAPFIKLNADTPVVARLFSQNLYQRFSGRQEAALFPVDRILKGVYRTRIDQAIFHGGRIDLEKEGLRYRLRLAYGSLQLPYMTWTSGQREFTPLLLGLYHVLPPRNTKKLKHIDWVVIEEPEMGLHPQAIAVFMLLVLDLLWRGYRVVISTHSPLVLDVVWAIRQLSATNARWKLLSEAFGVQGTSVREVMEHALKCDYRVFYLHHKDNKVESKDISTLDPNALDESESEWGGLTKFSSQFGDAVRVAVNESEQRRAE